MKKWGRVIRYMLAALVIGLAGPYSLKWYKFNQRLIDISSGPAVYQDVNLSIIQDQQQFLSSHDTYAYLILKDGQLIHEWYADDYDAVSVFGIASLAKALIGGITLFKAVSDGYINFDDFAYETIPLWQHDSKKSKIKIFHLASHTSGMEDTCTSAQRSTCASWKKDYWPNRHNAKGFKIANELATLNCEPGNAFLYSNPAYNNVLAYILGKNIKKNSQLNIPDYYLETVSIPLGVPAHNIDINDGDIVNFDNLQLVPVGGGSSVSARAAIRIGQLILNNGRWNNVSIISPETLDTALRSTHLPRYKGSDIKKYPTPAIGGWWLNTDKVWNNVPADTIVGAGADHQIVVIVPSKNLVAVRFGRKLGNDGWGGDYWVSLERDLLNPLLSAIRE